MQTSWYSGQPLSCEIAALKLFISEDQLRLCHRRRLPYGGAGKEAGFERFDSPKTRGPVTGGQELFLPLARAAEPARLLVDTTPLTVPGEGC